MTASKLLPEQSVLNALLSYDPATGKLFWRERPPSMFASNRTSAEDKAMAWNRQWAGKEALRSLSVGGYLKGGLCKQHVMAHRVIWKMVFGEDANQIDHINGDRTDNRLVNLRSVSVAENNRNRRLPVTNKSGVMGVCWATSVNKWMAYVRGENRKIIHLGFFEDKAQAARARAEACRSLGYHPNHGQRASEVLRPPLGVSA
jgi:hypothetical protein